MSEHGLSTRLIHSGDGQDFKKLQEASSVPEVFPVFLTSVFSFDDAGAVDAIYDDGEPSYIYTRMRHPNTDAVCRILAAAEESEDALVFSSGMSAIIFSILSVVQSGDHIVSSPVLYGGVQDFLARELKRFGIETTFVDFIHGDIESAFRPNTRLVYTETICNPLLEVPDLKKIAGAAHHHGALFFIDNTFATPVVARPLKFGADLVLYSATKYLGGHSDLTGGAAAGSAELIAQIRKTLVLYGPILSPSESWLLARSLRTLELRVTRHSQNALEVARFLEQHPKVRRVYYPGLESSPYHALAAAQFNGGLFGGMLSFDLDSAESAAKLISVLPSIKYVPSLAGTATTLSWPARTSHRAYSPEARAKAGIAEGQLRLSVGLENVTDLIAELSAGLDSI